MRIHRLVSTRLNERIPITLYGRQRDPLTSILIKKLETELGAKVSAISDQYHIEGPNRGAFTRAEDFRRCLEILMDAGFTGNSILPVPSVTIIGDKGNRYRVDASDVVSMNRTDWVKAIHASAILYKNLRRYDMNLKSHRVAFVVEYVG